MKRIPLNHLSLLSILGFGLSASLWGGEPDLKFSAKLLALDLNEGSAVFDVNNDGVLDIVAGRNWFAGPDYTPRPVRTIEDNNGHIHSNGDGRVDVLFEAGWYEQPAEGIGDNPWIFHEDWTITKASVPILVRDLNGDGRNDFIYGFGHDYGLFWREQLEPAADGTLQWKEHLIDDSFSQAHVLHFADIDGDGKDELITGKRVFAHNGKDPGGKEEPVLYYYNWDKRTKSFERKTILEGIAGVGLQINTADLNGDGRLDIVVAGKSGTYVIFNEGRR